MAKLRFGAFLAPHHPVGEHPMLLLRRDLDFAAERAAPTASVCLRTGRNRLLKKGFETLTYLNGGSPRPWRFSRRTFQRPASLPWQALSLSDWCSPNSWLS
jgi:hypothetical protein